MSIQKIGASWLTANQETNVALATLNLDFSLLKIEAPAEFKPLGNELSKRRLEAAEAGSAHVTARKLGALFQHWLPRTPHLIRVYGKRASEIAARRDVNPKATRDDGIFADHVGIDGTTIWAAATSGSGAIAVHLLGCMLARVWSRSEATAIWDELVSERQKELLSTDETDPLYEPSHTLGRLQITRDQLREWDSGARAWLQAADEAMKVKQTQLMLIANNVSLPVNTGSSLYQNVLQAWMSALVATDNLIQGVPQSTETGSVLLGLTAWHIYPDMLVLQDSPVPIEQHDPLVKAGGLLTVGLQIQHQNHNGVYWSLPLGNLRYYGGPVLSETSLDKHGNRVTISQIMQIATGCLTRNWGIPRKDVAMLILKLWDYVSPFAQAYSQGTQYWLGHLADALEPMRLPNDDLAKKQCQQLMHLGERRCHKSFLIPDTEFPAVFGVIRLSTFICVMETSESAIQHLRQVVPPASNSGRAFIIRYRNPSGSSATYIYATATPVQDESRMTQSWKHITWLPKGLKKSNEQRSDEFVVHDPRVTHRESSGGRLSSSLLRWYNPPEVYNSFCKRDTYLERSDKYMDLDLVAGDPKVLALYSIASISGTQSQATISENVDIEIFLSALQLEILHPEKLLKQLDEFMNSPKRRNTWRSLRALVTVKSVYSMLPNTTVSLEVTSQILHKMLWIPEETTNSIYDNRQRFSAYSLDRQQSFSCIILFETGTYSLAPDSLGRILAVATGDSIYIAAPLLCDPSETPLPHEIRRIRGNIGRSGIAILIPPQASPEVRSIESSSWKVVSHDVFDGKLHDAFKTSTLHLSFTDYMLPIDVGVHGLRDFEIYFLESVVSLHDRGEWVADLDILRQLDSDKLCRVNRNCDHKDPVHQASTKGFEASALTAIDHWDEILDPPDSAAVVRSTSNWIARLAATALCLQRGYSAIILPDHFCMLCVTKAWRSRNSWNDKIAKPLLSFKKDPTRNKGHTNKPAPENDFLRFEDIFLESSDLGNSPVPPSFKYSPETLREILDTKHKKEDNHHGAFRKNAHFSNEPEDGEIDNHEILKKMAGVMVIC